MNPCEISSTNEVINSNLTAAMAALRHLNDQGCIVRGIKIGTRRPVIVIANPNSSEFLHGAQRMRYRTADGHRVIKVASVYGCQVEWKEDFQSILTLVQS